MVWRERNAFVPDVDLDDRSKALLDARDHVVRCVARETHAGLQIFDRQLNVLANPHQSVWRKATRHRIHRALVVQVLALPLVVLPRLLFRLFDHALGKFCRLLRRNGLAI